MLLKALMVIELYKRERGLPFDLINIITCVTFVDLVLLLLLPFCVFRHHILSL